MLDAPVPSQVVGSTAPRWAVRIFVLGAFAVTVWLCGPRAVVVLAARLDKVSQQSPTVALDHVGFL
ncbi:MAG: hypothetical protein ABIP94_20530, partial [Planctomycetota bacterium]